jgi:DNA-binding CsgD family transcriptional regulator/tetratricopeptide (TPR) repeat protein
VSRVGPLVCPILVGRDEILALVERRFGDVLDGRGQSLLIAGDAGIGKTRLLSAIEDRASTAGFRAAAGGLSPQDLDVPGAALLDLARSMRRLPELAPLGRSLLERLANPSVDVPLELGRRRRLLVLDIVDSIGEACVTPTFLAFEDLHWADDLSLEVLGSLARRLPDMPLFVVATFRADQVATRSSLREWRARLLTQRQADEVRLSPLTRDETAVMARTLIDGTVPDEVAAAIHERTDGIPLYVEELVGMLADRRPSTAEDVRAAGVPDTIEATILERLRSRSDEARLVASVGAVIGRRFVPELVARIVDRPLEGLTESLEELVNHAFLEPPGTGGELDFRNQLLRDAIYAATPATQRRRLHGLVAEFGGDIDGASEIHASGHYELAGRRDEAHRAALAGARTAARISAHREALELYRRAVRNLPADTPAGERGRILEELAQEEVARDETAAAAETLSRARSSYADAGDRLAAAGVVAVLAGVQHLLGGGAAAIQPMLDDVLASLHHLEGEDADRVRGRLEAALAAAYGRALQLPATEVHAARAIELAKRVGDPSTELNAMNTLVMTRPFAGRLDETVWLAGEVIDRARELHLEDEAARTYRMLGCSMSEVMAPDAAERWLRDGIAFAARSELWNHRCYMTAHLGLVLWETGRWDEADALADAALREGRGGVTTQITGFYVRGFVALGRGRQSEAAAFLRESLFLGEQSGDILRVSFPLWGLAETALLGGRIEEAIALTERGRAVSAAVADVSFLTQFVVTGTRARLASGGTAAAAHWLDDVGAVVIASGMPALRPAVDHAQGLIALAGGETSRARALLRDAIRGWDGVRRTWEGTWARLDLAACVLRTKGVQEATELVTDARSVAESLGSRPLTDRAVELLRVARSRPQFGERWAPLSAREFDVARLVAAGQTNAEIGRELTIAPKTVASHVEHILAKLDATRRTEIAAWAARIAETGDSTVDVVR